MILHDLVDAGQPLPEQILRPALQRLRHHGMVGIGKGAGDDAVGILPPIAALIQQNPHQLRNRQRGMGVVDMHRRHLRQIVHGAVFFQMALHNILHGSRY